MMQQRHLRVSMWKDQLRGITPARGQYSSALCPNGINYCSNDTAWADCCHSFFGTYTINVNTAYNYLQNAGFYGDLPFIMLALIQRESNFAPDAVASCAQCCCTEAGVYAVGILQFETIGHIDLGPTLMGGSFTGWESLVAWCKDPANNCIGAKYLYDHGGLGHWTPLNGADSDSSIAYWRGQVAAGGGGAVIEPGVSLAADIEAAPQPSPPPDIPALAEQPVVNPPPDMVRLTYPGPPAIYNDSTSGWESVTRYFTNDIPYYTGYDKYLVDILHRLPGSAG